MLEDNGHISPRGWQVGAGGSGTRFGRNGFLVRQSVNGVQKFYIGFVFCLAV